MVGGPALASGPPGAPASSGAALLPRLDWPGSQPWAQMGKDLMSQGHQPAVPLGPRPGNGHVLGFGCFPGLERKHSLPRDALCFPWTDPSAARGAQRGQTLYLCALCHCAVRMSFILAVPRLCASISTPSSHPASPGSELGAKTLARAAVLRASRELLPIS